MTEFSVYPNAIDGYAQLPLVVDNVTRVDAVTINRIRCAIVNIENELGVLPSGTNHPTVRSRLDTLDLTDLENRVAKLESDMLELSPLETLGYKNPTRVATTENVSLTGGAPLSVDGVIVANNDRILVCQQTIQSENGIYVVQNAGTGSDGTWVRAGDANTGVRLVPGSEIYIVEGGRAGCKFWLITPGPIILGVTDLEFVGGLGVMRTDSAPTTILTATAIGASEATATSTDSISVRNFKDIDFSFTVTSLGAGPITEVRARILYSLLKTPGLYSVSPEDWNIMLSEDIISGVATVDPYTISLDSSLYPDFSILPGSFSVKAPTAGLHMMMLIWSGAGDPTGSSFVGITLRRA